MSFNPFHNQHAQPNPHAQRVAAMAGQVPSAQQFNPSPQFQQGPTYGGGLDARTLIDNAAASLAAQVPPNGGQLVNPTGDAFGAAWFLLNGGSEKQKQLAEQARRAGEVIGPTTQLRNVLRTVRVYDLNATTFPKGAVQVPFDRSTYITKMTATLSGAQVTQGWEPSTSLDNQTTPLDYILMQITRSGSEQIMTEPVVASEITGTGKLSYMWDLVPYVSKGDTLTVNWQIDQSPDGTYALESAQRLSLTFHCAFMPIAGT